MNRRLVGWTVAALVVAAGAIPWFMWRNGATVAGLPRWLWWHVAWMLLASFVFYAFARTSWGLGVDPDRGAGASPPVERTEPGPESGGERP